MSAHTLKDYAHFICLRLREAGYQAYLVGGCVRDTLLGKTPKDFDIATDASPAGILEVFPAAIPVGAHFGVMLVREGEHQVEVATFRSDGQYSDGRRPDSVQFVSDPRHDAERRDFTINALFLDPSNGEVLDFTGGRFDLENRVIRAIGVPEERFQEDHLRLLRAVRFAERLGFAIEPVTFAAVRKLAPLIHLVAAERVRDELNRILPAATLLFETGLLEQILPEVVWNTEVQERLRLAQGLPLSWAALLADLQPKQVRSIISRLKFSNADAGLVFDLVANRGRLLQADQLPLPELKRLMRDPDFGFHVEFHRLCGLEIPTLPQFTDAELHPKALLTGLDLMDLGYPQGPVYAHILQGLEDAQLAGSLMTRDDAVRWVRERF